MRWDLWWKGAVASGFITLIAVAPALVSDGVTSAEAWALLASFLGGIALWCKDHKPVWDGTERRAEELKK